MNEKSLKVLEQYEIEVTSAKRGRGSYICETDQGKKLLMDYTGSEKKLAFVNRVLEELKKDGYAYADIAMKNKEEKFISYDRDENAYILKDWYEGRECDTRNLPDIEQAVTELARLHGRLEYPALLQETGDAYCDGDLAAEMERHNRELRKIYTYISRQKKKNDFEILFLKCYPVFFEQAQEALGRLADSGYGALRRKSIAAGRLCHGNYNQHNIWFLGRRQAFTGNLDRCCFGVQQADLYQFLRKIMEKQDWNQGTGQRMLETYERERALEAGEWDYLYVRLLYPEKFWKLANQYYNHKKTWVAWKNTEKLETLLAQQEARNSFLKLLE